jgi:hypothetical protein
MTLDAMTILAQLWGIAQPTLGALPADAQELGKEELTGLANRIATIGNDFLSGNPLTAAEMKIVLADETEHLKQVLSVAKDIGSIAAEKLSSNAFSIGLSILEGIVKLAI